MALAVSDGVRQLRKYGFRLVRDWQADADSLRSAWSRNDGKPREEWAPGLDLKELVLTGALVVAVATMAVVVIAPLT